MDSRTTADLIVHVGRIASSDGLVHGLTPVQWTILRYFARANRFSRTPSAFAAFHGTTRGTASQAIKNLVARGFLSQHRSGSDARSIRLDLTGKGHDILADDPLGALVKAIDGLPDRQRATFSRALLRVVCEVSGAGNGNASFGTCESCVHLETGCYCRDVLSAYCCGLAEEALGEDELDELCVNFEPGKKP